MTIHPDKNKHFIGDFSRHASDIVTGLKSVTNPSTRLTEAEADEYRALLESARVRPTDEIDEAPAYLTIEQDSKSYVISTRGNISTVAGPAKAKKTFAVSVAIAAAVSSSLMLNRIQGRLPPEKQTVILFDTEQSKQHVLRVIKRICRLCGTENPPNLIVYSLRSYAPQERLKIVDFALHNTPDLGLVVIDGVRDLAVDPILDSEQASKIMTCLLGWTDQLEIHVMCVLHQNKNDGNLRGHIGTELVNKSETVISISRDEQDEEISIVAPKYCRDREFDKFSFSIDEAGLPFFVENKSGDLGGKNDPKSGTRKTKTTATSITPDTIKSIITRAFAKEEYLQYGKLRTSILEAAQFVGATLIKNEAELLIQRVTQNGHLIKFKPEGFRWDVYRISSDYLPDQLS